MKYYYTGINKICYVLEGVYLIVILYIKVFSKVICKLGS